MLIDAVLASVLVSGPAVQAAAVIPVPWRPFAECVSRRESNHNYRARNPRSSAQGRWQLLDQAWRVNGGVEWIVSRQLRKVGLTWAQRAGWVTKLDATPIYKWPAWAQDAAFVGVVTERSTGWRHWYLSGSKCNRLVPRGT